MRLKDQLSKLKQTELAALLGCADRTIQRWHEHGLPRHGEGRGTTYVWAEVLPWYVSFVSQSAGEAGRGGPEGESSLERKLRAEADIAEMKARQMAGTLLEAGDVAATWSSALARMRSRLLALPAKAALLLEDGQTIGQRQHLVETQVHEALAELATREETP